MIEELGDLLQAIPTDAVDSKQRWVRWLARGIFLLVILAAITFILLNVFG